MKPIESLYNTLVQDGYDVGDLNTFSTKLQDSNKAKALYDAISNDGYDVGDFDNFYGKLKPTVQFDDYSKQLGAVPVQKPQAIKGAYFTPELEKQAQEQAVPQNTQPLSPEEANSVIYGGIPGTTKIGNVNIAPIGKDWQQQAAQLPTEQPTIMQGVNVVAPQVEALTSTFEQPKVDEGANAFDFVEKFNQGGANVGKNLFGSLQKLYSGLKNDLPLPGANWYYGKAEDAMAYLSNYFGGVEKQMIANTDKYNGKDFMQLAKEGDYSGVVGDIMLNATSSLPQSLMIMFGGGAGLATSALATQNEAYDQLEGKDMSEIAKIGNSILNSAIQTGTEFMSTIPMGKVLTGLATKVGKEETAKLMQASTKTWLDKLFKQYGVYIAPVSEGIEEFTSQVGTNTLDYLTGATNTFEPFKDSFKSFVYGAGGGAQFSMAGIPMQVAQQVKSKKDFQSADNNLTTLLSKNGFTAEDVADIKNSLLQATPENRNSVVVAISQAIDGAITKTDGKVSFSPEVSKTFTDFLLSSDRLQAVNTKYNQSMEAERAETLRLEQEQQTILNEKQQAADQLQSIASPDGMIRTVKMMDGTEMVIRGEKVVFDPETGRLDRKNSSEMLYYNERDENGKEILDENGKPIVKVLNPKLVDSILSEKPIEQAAFETDQLIDQEISDKELDEFLPLQPETYQDAQGTIQVRYNPQTSEIEAVLVDEQSMTPISEPYTIDKATYAQMSGKQLPETIKTTANEPLNDGSAPVVSGDMTENTPIQYPVNKKGEIDFDAMTVAQTYQYMVDNYGQEEAIKGLTMQEHSIQGLVQQNIKALTTAKETIEGQIRKATSIQEQLKIREKNKSEVTKLTDERTALDTQLAEIRALLPQVEQAPAQPEVKAVTSSNVRPEEQLRREQEAKKVESEKLKVESEETAPIETTKQKIERLKKVRLERGEVFEMQQIPETPQKYTINVANMDLPLAPVIPLESIDWPATFGSTYDDYELPNSVKLIEVRGRNNDGKLVGTVSANYGEFGSNTYEVVFNDKLTAEPEQQPVIEVREKEEWKGTPQWTRRLINLGDAMTVEDVVLRRIAGGAKFVWTASAPLKGLAEELGFTNKPGERKLRKNLIDNENGMTPQEFAHVIYESGDLDFMPGVEYQDVYNAVVDTLLQVNSATAAMEMAEQLRDSREFSMNEQAEWDSITPEEANYLESIPDDILESYLGINNFTPEQLDIIQNLQNEYYGNDRTTTEASAVDSTPGIESETAAEPRTTEEVSSLIDELAFKSNNADKFIQNLQVGMFDLTSEEINPIIGLSTDNTPEQNISIAKKYYSEAKKRHAKLVAERKQEADNARAEQNVSAIEKLALEQIADMDKLIAASESKPIKNGDTVTYKSKQYTVNGIYAGNKEVDLEDEKGNLMHEEVPVSELNQEKPISKHDKATAERKQRILSEGTGFDEPFGLIPVSEIKSAAEIQANIEKIITTLKDNQGNGYFLGFEGFAMRSKYAKNAGEQIRQYFMSIDVLPIEIRKEFAESIGITTNDELVSWGEKKYNELNQSEQPLENVSSGNKLTEQVSAAQAEADAALQDFLDAFNDLNSDNLGIVDNTAEKQAKMLVAGTKMVGAYTKLGVYKFAELLQQLQAKGIQITEDLLSAIKKAYGAFAAENDIDALDDMKTVRQFKLSDIEKAPEKAVEEIQQLFNGQKKDLTQPENNSEENVVSLLENKQRFINAVVSKFGNEKLNIVALRKIAEESGFTEIKDTTIQEYTELAIIMKAHTIVKQEISQQDKYNQIVELYNAQPTISMRSSERIEKQQYSTPIPLSFLAGEFVNKINPKSVLEPSAGNGMMVFNVDEEIVIANEIDEVRLDNLRDQGFKEVTNQDGTLEFNIEPVDGVITNPPFGKSEARDYEGYKIAGLDEQMVVNALSSMKDDGRASIIIGGHTKYKQNGTLASEKAFLNYLYDKYNVADIINVEGSLYSKQGTSFPVRLILINGRRTGFESLQRKYAPLQKNAKSEPVKTFDELYKRIKDNENNLLRSGTTVQPDSGVRTTPTSNGGTIPAGTTATNKPSGSRQGESGATSTRPSSNGRPSDKPTKPTTSNDAGGSNIQPDATSGGQTVSGSTTRSKRRISTEDADKFLNRSNARPEPLKIDIEKEKTQYPARSKSAQIGSVVPTNVAQTINNILHKFEDIDAYVQTKLGYESKDELFNALAAEQIDSVALAIYQIENGKALIIGDMTGVGKGRQAAAIIRYAVMSGKRPIFITEKPQLFSDIYRDLRDIGSADLNPFILNSKGNEDPAMTDENGVIIYNTPKDAVKKQILASGKLPEEYDYAVLTYSQLNGNVEKNGLSAKQSFFRSIAYDNILVLDESHNAGGEGNTGTFMTETLPTTKGVVFLSGTFAKRADNMPIYAMKTSMNEANMSETELIEAIKTGGIPLQEIMSKNLTETGQMVRRERDFTGVTIDWQTMTDKKEQHWKTFDGVIELFNELIKFQKDYIDPVIEAMNDDVADVQGSVGARTGTEQLGISNVPFASKTFNLVRQMLFSLKAQEVADEAIKELKAGNKPVIAIGNTMETFINEIGAVGTTTDKHDYSLTLVRGLTGLFRVTETDANGERIQREIDKSIIGPEGLAKYAELEAKINKLSSGISISPIDIIKAELSKAGYSVGEMTGRTNELIFNEDGTATVSKRTNTDKKKLARDFNGGNIDVLILNQSASTGISLHASNKFKDQRKRVMLFAQNQLDVNTEVQMRGRIDRTGQVQRGAYRYIISPIPAEQRMIMMFKAKLKSLDANTTSSQKSKTNEIEVVDFLNKYGDEIIIEYLKENPDINLKMLDPFNLADKSEDELAKITTEVGASNKAAGRAALLNVKEQEAFYNEITEKYITLLNYLNDAGANDLEITTLPLKAETKSKHIVIQGKNSGNPFSEDSLRETVEVDVLKKPMNIKEVNEEIQKLTEGKTAVEYRDALIAQINAYTENQVAQETKKIQDEIGKKQESFFAKAEKEADRGKLEGEARNEFMDAKRQDFDGMMQLHIDTRTNAIRNRAQTILRTVKSLPVGKVVLIPSTLEIGTDTTYSEGMFLGFRMKEKLTPSTITAVFATLDGRRRIDVPLSKVPFLQAVYSETMQNIRHIKATPENWDSMIPTRTRKTAYIITGNILQAYGRNELRGQLVSYSTVSGEIRQGILLPDKYKSDEQAMRVQVIDRINDLRNGQALADVSNGVTIRKETPISYSISVPLSKVRGGKYFLDAGLRDLVYQKDFRQMAGQMVGMVSENKIEEALRYLSDKFNISVDVAIKKVDEGILNEPQPEYGKKLPATIDVDGIQRPTTNSTGKPIHSTEEGIRNFWRWFGDSKVVDSEGRPLVVYHGTNADFNEFDKKKAIDKEGKKLNLGFGKGVFYFTPIKSIALKYGTKTLDSYLNIRNIYDLKKYENKADYRNALNGYKVNNIWYSEIEDKNNKRAEKFIKELKLQKYDGIYGIDEIIVFSPTQIKSATGNDGGFDGEDANILNEPTQTLINFTHEEQKDETNKAYGSEEKQQEGIDKAIAEAEKLQVPGIIGGRTDIGRPDELSPVRSLRTVLAGFKESGYVNFNGTKVSSHQDIADLWSIHRSPYIEKSHVVFIKDGKIAGSMAMTSGKIGVTHFHSVENITKHANKLGATQVYFLHNHPSGNPTPSGMDIKLTYHHTDKLLAEGIDVLGHVIVDHDKYAFIDTQKTWPENLDYNTVERVAKEVELFDYKNTTQQLYEDRDYLGNSQTVRDNLFMLGRDLLSEPTYKAAIVYMSSNKYAGFSLSAYDILPNSASAADITRMVAEGLNKNLGQHAVIIHNGQVGYFGNRLHQGVVDVINLRRNDSDNFLNENIEQYDKDTLWVEQIIGKYGAANLDAAEEAPEDQIVLMDAVGVSESRPTPKPTPPTFTNRDTFLDRLQANKKYNDELKKWQSKNIQEIASTVGESNEVNAKLGELNKAVDATHAKLWEGWADSQKPVKKWQNYLKENGIDFLDTDDYYLRFTMVPSRVEYRFAEFEKKNIDTFVKTIKAFDNKGISYDDLATYAKLKHADEYTEHIINRKMKEREWKEERINLFNLQRTQDADIVKKYWDEWAEKKILNLKKEDQAKYDQDVISINKLRDRNIEEVDADFSGKRAIEERIGMKADEYISEIEKLAGQDLIDTFWKQTKAINEFSLDEEVRAGIRSSESAKEIKDTFKWYVPLKNHYDLTAEDAFDYSKERGTFFVSAVKKGKGRLSESGDPFSVMASTVRSTIGASEDNVLKQTLLRLAEKDTTGSTSVSKAWFVKVDDEVDDFGNVKPIFELAPEVPYTDTDTQETYTAKIAAHNEKMKQLAEKGEAYQGKIPKLKLGVWIKPTNVREHEVHVMRNGETYLIRFNTSPRIAQAVNKVNYRYYEGAIGRTFEEIGKVTRFMAAAKTMFRPTFIFITNPLRDIHAGLNLAFIDEGAAFAANVASYIPRAAYTLGRRMTGNIDLNDKYDKALNTYLLNGGKTGISKILELKQVERDLKDRMNKKIHPWDSFKKVYQSISEITENQVRLAVYFAAIDKGYSALKATSMAKEATINFDRKGNGRNGLREFKSMYAFINVGFQALDNIYTKSTKDSASKKRFIGTVAMNAFAGGILVSLISSAIAAAFGADDDEWLEDFSKLSSFERNANFLVWTPNGVLKYPLGQEFRIYHALGMDFMMLAHGKTTATETAINMIKGLSSLVPYNPIESTVMGSWGSAMPDVVSPFTELATNRDWMGSRIYKENQSSEQAGYTKVRTNKRGEPYATETMMLFAKALDKGTGGDGAKKGWLSPNPDIVEHLLGGYLAGLYTQAMTIAESGVKADPSEFIPSAIWKSGYDIKQRNSGLNEKYFEAKDEVKEMTRLIKVYNQQLERNENEYKSNLINEESYSKVKQSLIEKIDYLQNDEYYKKNAIIKQIGQTEDELPGAAKEKQLQTESQISELKTSLVETKPVQGYLGAKTKYDALLDKVHDYRKQKLLTGKENPELDEAYGRLYGSFGKMKSIHTYVSAIEKQIKENNENVELTPEEKKQQNAELEATATELMNHIIQQP